jgi:citrate lyase subunit beta / citryl-CoA lyase
LEDGVIRIAALMPQAFGMSCAGLSRRLVALGWSALALQKLTGARRMHDGEGLLTDMFRHARSSVLLAAAQAHVEALDAASGLFSTERLARDCKEAAADGFTGKLTFSPRQVTAINHGFLPTQDEVEEAKAILSQPELAEAPERLRAVRVTQRAMPEKS